MAEPKKIIIDTDPGIDDAMAIFLALRSPEVNVIGLTTIYGNVYTTLATRNALHLLEVAGRTYIPVAEGSHVSYVAIELDPAFTKNIGQIVLLGGVFLVNGNVNPASEANIYGDPEAADIVFTCEADVLAIGLNLEVARRTDIPVAEGSQVSYVAIELDPAFTKNIGQIVLLGGAFLVNGNVNPASEANIFGDPEAADIVFTCGADVGYWAQYHDRDILAESDGIFAKYLSKILEFYFSYHRDAYNMKGVYLHDPTTILAAVNPSLMTYMEGVIRVQTTGITRGLSLFFNKQKRFNEETEWCNKPTVKVAVTVDAPEVVKLVMQRLMY
ncbi:putative inosine/uridine-preferring nucleoside hydrolase domain, ribonucleoside hydrolase [Helianthus annuus]|nr:putative inosine/uridine-preferring nucleoside hydrolase domain, ribonucleoside hydrolase [Helianthus annuus]KAJ0788103.1 putative inosine/uridine-preferring nucleoside hydrolase domain, ribonucleoside hydrolase [Helianthus annuus]